MSGWSAATPAGARRSRSPSSWPKRATNAGASAAAWTRSGSPRTRARHAAIDDPTFVSRFGQLDGDRLRRAPAGVAADHPDIALLTLKDVTFGRRLDDREAFSSELPEILASDLATAVPLLRLLATLDG